MEIMPFLDLLIIDNYNDRKEINTPELEKIYAYIQEHEEMKKRVIFSFRLQNEVLLSRGGQAPNKKKAGDARVLDVMCSIPFRQLIIRPTGEISLCCNDALGKYTLGNLNTQSVAEIWTSEKYESIRTDMLTGKRREMPLCRDCDTVCGFGPFTSRKRP